MKLIEAYLMVDKKECGRGTFNSNVNRLYDSFSVKHKGLLDGAEVFADYEKNVFRLCHESEADNESVLYDFESFGTYYTQRHSSTGEAVVVALNSMFRQMFSEKARLTFDYGQFKEEKPDYWKYVEDHRASKEHDAYTILMDEPDRNLDIKNIEQIKFILSTPKEQTQIIAVVHNPLLIYGLSKNPNVNMIEMEEGYAKEMRDFVDNMCK